jgi:hypothetical protein
MSVKKLFDNNKRIVTVGKFLKLGSPNQLGDGIESAKHLELAIKKRDYFLPPYRLFKSRKLCKVRLCGTILQKCF